MLFLSAEERLSRLKGLQQFRYLSDDVTRGAFILLHYCGEIEISVRQISRSFHISRSLQRRVKSILEGHTDHSLKKTRYLSPFHEARLAELIKCREDKRESFYEDDIKDMVCLLSLSYSPLTLFSRPLRWRSKFMNSWWKGWRNIFLLFPKKQPSLPVTIGFVTLKKEKTQIIARNINGG